MKDVHLCFRIDNSLALSNYYNFFNIGHNNNYFDNEKTLERLHKLSNECYIPANHRLMDAMFKMKKEKKSVKISIDISRQTIKQLEKYRPDVLESFQALAKTNNVEFLCSANSMLFFLLQQNNNKDSKIEKHNANLVLQLKDSLEKHKKLIKKHFDYEPTTFINYGLIYSDLIGKYVYDMGFKCIIAEGAKSVLGWRSPNYLYQSKSNFRLKLLFRNYILSDLLTFKFSDNNENITANNFANNIVENASKDDITNLIFDYEMFGFHHKKEQGILDFLYYLPQEILKHKNVALNTPKKIIKSKRPIAKVEVSRTSSASGLEKDASEWYGNDFQHVLLNSIYNLKSKIKKKKNKEHLKYWEQLLHPEYFGYLDTQWKNPIKYTHSDNPFNSPEDAFINMSNIINDLSIRLQ